MTGLAPRLALIKPGVVGGPGVKREVTIPDMVELDGTVTVDEDTGEMEDSLLFVVEVLKSGFGPGLDIVVKLETAKELDD